VDNVLWYLLRRSSFNVVVYCFGLFNYRTIHRKIQHSENCVRPLHFITVAKSPKSDDGLFDDAILSWKDITRLSGSVINAQSALFSHRFVSMEWCTLRKGWIRPHHFLLKWFWDHRFWSYFGRYMKHLKSWHEKYSNEMNVLSILNWGKTIFNAAFDRNFVRW